MKTKTLLLLSVAGFMMLAGCKQNGGEGSNENASSQVSSPEYDFDTISIAEAIEICSKNTTAPTTDRYYIAGYIESIDDYNYGQMTIKDDTGSILVYGAYSADGVNRFGDLEDKPKVGDLVVLYSTLTEFDGTPEIKSGWIVFLKHIEIPFDETQYSEMNIAKAREQEKGKLIKTTGVVTTLTKAANGSYDGFFLVDSTSSIYIHGNDVSAEVKVGNTITICGKLTYWILDTETASAKKFGYNGSVQLAACTIVNNDKGSKELDLSWVTETTVKEMMNTPVASNVTNKIFKVNSYVKKSVSTGFTNYYFNDIDGVTGSYTYTKCNGSDYAWLDEFDGKICTVYLTAANAKSQPTGCVWRFVPIKVSYDNYQFDKANVNSYVWEYHVKDLFEAEYTGDPAMEVPTSVSSTILDFAGATITYSSSNTAVADFETSAEKTTFHTKGTEGKTTISVTINYGTNAALVKTFEVAYKKPEVADSLNVKQAIEAADKETITVRGIAGPSLVNQVGFYLIDETGAIAVKTDADTMAQISLGNEVILKGQKNDHYGLKEGSTVSGQICLLDSKIVANLYGKHDYSTASFTSGKTLPELYGIDAETAASAQVYTVKATVLEEVNAKFSNIYLVEGETKLSLYCSSSKQYKFLSAFADKEVTVEVALCNWNNKKFYKGAVLSVAYEGSKTVNTLNYTAK